MTYGDVAKSWDEIVTSYDELASINVALRPAATLARQISRSGYVEAGLCGLTSMCELIVGPGPAVLDNPHLILSLDTTKGDFVLTYPSRDVYAKKWTRRATADEVFEVFEVFERFLTRRARWYKNARRGPTTQ